MNFDCTKYKRANFQPKNFKDRQWPDKEITKAPIWCSVDLRDGNQSLPTPMNVDEKIKMFNMLLEVGFKEIEIGFPSASQTEYDFLRKLIDEDLIPDDVTIQVLTQSREHLIVKTFESLKGCKKAIVHLYNSTSILQRDVVFHKSKDEIIDIAVKGAEIFNREAKKYPQTKFQYEYSPESFTGTEMDYALDVCNAVVETWGADKDNKVIINLPSTVQMDTPNIFADQIEYICRGIKSRENVIISVHPHNDRGTGVADAEMALLAGADRVEGTLFGNGERTGNVDILTVAYNMFSHGVNPELNIENINEIIEVYERCVKIPVHVRHPYAGNLVFTAFSGSHQDAINKGMKKYNERHNNIWQVPYLPVDPTDLGREYEPLVRINSQSGKGGVAFIMDHCFGYKLPKSMQQEFAEVVQKISEFKGEVQPNEIMDAFRKQYLDIKEPMNLNNLIIEDIVDGNENANTRVKAEITFNDEEYTIEGIGNGPIDSFLNGLSKSKLINVKILDYKEHALSMGSEAEAASYVYMERRDSFRKTFGVGVDSNITKSSIKAMISAINRLYK